MKTIQLLSLWLLLSILQSLQAQHINNVFAFQSEHKNAMMLNGEFDPALFWGISYNRSIDIKMGTFERRVNTQIG